MQKSMTGLKIMKRQLHDNIITCVNFKIDKNLYPMTMQVSIFLPVPLVKSTEVNGEYMNRS